MVSDGQRWSVMVSDGQCDVSFSLQGSIPHFRFYLMWITVAVLLIHIIIIVAWARQFGVGSLAFLRKLSDDFVVQIAKANSLRHAVGCGVYRGSGKGFHQV